MIEETHKAITRLLESGGTIRSTSDKANEQDQDPQREKLVKQIIEAVSPIIPIVIRNKSLDGSYFRSALHLLGAAELLFSQYENDIRVQANPAGFVGTCDAMHAELKRAAVYAHTLKPLPDFMKEIKMQYQTSLGLGNSFPHDRTGRSRRRRRGTAYTRDGRWRRTSRYPGYSERPAAGTAQTNEFTGYGRGSTGRGARFAQAGQVAISGRGPCYAFQDGACRRGESCRFSHVQ